MIAIVNITPQAEFEEDPFGTHLYEVRINRIPKARFSHTRGEGLAVCLRRAADAVGERTTARSCSLWIPPNRPNNEHTITSTLAPAH